MSESVLSEGHFRALAEQALGSGLAFAQTSLLRRLRALLEPGESVTVLTVAAHGIAGSGILMLTPRRFAYCVRRLAVIHQIRNYKWDEPVSLLIDSPWRIYILRLRQGNSLRFSIMLDIVKEPSQEDVLRMLIPLAVNGTWAVESTDPFVEELVQNC